jgi:dTDP-4-dehydrorhamnose reductase
MIVKFIHAPSLSPKYLNKPIVGSGIIAVLGSTGMLGQALCRVAGRRGLNVVGVARQGSTHCVDATNALALRQALDIIAPRLIINASAQTSLDACERDPGAAYMVNAHVVATLADYCTVKGLKLVQISTDHYFTGDADRLHSEESPVRLLNEYARSKYVGEAFANTCPDSLILRTNLVGFRAWPDRPTFVEWAISALASGERMTLFEDFYTSSLDVFSFSEALFDLIEQNAHGLLNLAARESTSKAHFLLKLAEALKLSSTHCRMGSVRAIAGVPRAESLGLDVSRAEALLGWSLPDPDAVIASLVEIYKG